jgi:hypothetical protein
MNDRPLFQLKGPWPTLTGMPTPAKALFTAIIFTMAIAMVGALGQIIVHDIIPTFLGEGKDREYETAEPADSNKISVGRGDLLADQPMEGEPAKPFYKSEQFVWTLKWTHIHLFGMSIIFIFMGIVTLFLGLSPKVRIWLIVLPFVGVQIDIASMWLKGYVSPAFFWLHIPGGGLFATVFVIVSCRALFEMWGSRWSTQ